MSEGELPLIDNAGDPKLPAFLYDEDTTDGSLAKGLLHGPLLLAVSFHCFARQNTTDNPHSGIHLYLCSTFCCHRREGVVKARECKNSWDGEGPPFDDLLCGNTRSYRF